MGGYKDSEEKAAEIFDQYKKEKLKTISVGDSFFLGKYEQDNDKSNGKEPIEWQVLDKKGSKVLLISKYGIDGKYYSKDYTDFTWAPCSLRKWLNEVFIKDAFGSSDRAMIQTTFISDKGQGKSTEDKVFVLNMKEAKKYFEDDESRLCVSTAYADAQLKAQADEEGNYFGYSLYCDWWLRSPGKHEKHGKFVVNVDEDGGISDTNVDCYFVAVRPALWVDLD